MKVKNENEKLNFESQSYKLLTGNEAIAQAAYEAGVKVATAYPGTPSTEILENISKYKSIYCQWSVNEKVALEVASGASIAGARALVAMKHVGLNVAADPFMTLSYTGVNGGLVIISADDPNMHSSQNEQDNRFYAKFAKVPMLEPSDSQEALDMVKLAFDISENYDTPVIVRTTTRISHSRSLVKIGSVIDIEQKKYIKDAKKYVMIPAYARLRHQKLLQRWEQLKNLAEDEIFYKIFIPDTSKLDNFKPDTFESRTSKKENLKIYMKNQSVGIITSGISFQYTREVFFNYPIFKLNMTNPIPAKAITNFATDKNFLIVVEELEPFLEEQIKLLNLPVEVVGKKYFPINGELNLEIVQKVYNELFFKSIKSSNENFPSADNFVESLPFIESLPPRPPVLCAGCPHRPVFHVLKKLKVAVMGDIGCYTLSVLPPLNSLDSCLCMGAGIGQALGIEKANPELKGKIVSVIGDSTFFHSGITPLIDSVYNESTGVIIILDNQTTAMTGHQDHPGTGKTLMGNLTETLKPEEFAKAAGVKSIHVIDPYKIGSLEKLIKEELAKQQLSVIVCRRPCVLLDKSKKNNLVLIDYNKCRKCGLCYQFGCPAIELRDDRYLINNLLCNGCGVCIDICKWKAIEVYKEN